MKTTVPHRQQVEEMQDQLQEVEFTFKGQVTRVVPNTLTPWRPLQVMGVALRALNMSFWCVGFFQIAAQERNAVANWVSVFLFLVFSWGTVRHN